MLAEAVFTRIAMSYHSIAKVLNLWDYKLWATTNIFPSWMGHEKKKVENPAICPWKITRTSEWKQSLVVLL